MNLQTEEFTWACRIRRAGNERDARKGVASPHAKGTAYALRVPAPLAIGDHDFTHIDHAAEMGRSLRRFLARRTSE
jgi:hypothetical protein